MVSNIKQSPLVSITCLTYNHAPYLRQCLDGFVMQKTSFPIEILIYDDASEDGTQDIIREYERKYPDLIKPIYQTENQYSKGVKVEFVYNYPRAKGKYIAFCEGDDYWTDPNKLQKQIDFLERHQEHVMCSHQYKLYFQKEKIMDHAIRPIGNFSDGISFDPWRLVISAIECSISEVGVRFEYVFKICNTYRCSLVVCHFEKWERILYV